MNMTDTTPTESNLSGLDRKDFQKNINNKKTWFPTKTGNMPMSF